MIREKHIKSGPLFECDFYPIWENGHKIPNRAPKTHLSTDEQKKYNQTKSIKKFIRYVNANFGGEDVIMHPTYEQDKAPKDDKAARRDLINYIRRVKSKRKTELGLVNSLLENKKNDKKLQALKKKLEEPFKYIYVIEKQTYKSGKNAGRDNWHFHLFLTGGLERDTMENLWSNGIRVNVDRFQPEKFGPESAAIYMSKDPKGTKRFTYSRNLSNPNKTKKTKDGKISRQSVEKLATQRVDDKTYWEHRFKGYRFIRCFSRYNNYNGHWYVSVIMYKSTSAEELPPWQIDDWILE